MKINPTCEFYIHKAKTFTVSAKAWWMDVGDEHKSGWNWNVYAYVFDNHPMYSDDQYLKDLPLHGGCTFDELVVSQPLNIEYDFQCVKNKKVIGSDYNHLYDQCQDHQSPMDGVPRYVMNDAKQLADELIRTAGEEA